MFSGSGKSVAASEVSSSKQSTGVSSVSGAKLSSIESTEQFLKENGIAFKTIRHVKCMTNDELREAAKFEGEYEGTAIAKQLFLYNKKKKDQMWLVSAANFTNVNMKALEKHLKTGSGNLRGADAETLEKYLGCVKGLVNYFAIVNDVE